MKHPLRTMNFISNFMVIHEIVVVIFHSGAKWSTSGQTNTTIRPTDSAETPWACIPSSVLSFSSLPCKPLVSYCSLPPIFRCPPPPSLPIHHSGGEIPWRWGSISNDFLLSRAMKGTHALTLPSSPQSILCLSVNLISHPSMHLVKDLKPR